MLNYILMTALTYLTLWCSSCGGQNKSDLIIFIEYFVFYGDLMLLNDINAMVIPFIHVLSVELKMSILN